MSKPVLTICKTCKSTSGEVGAGEALLARLQKETANSSVVVTGAECLSNCNRSCSAALMQKGKWSYVYGDLDPISDVSDLIALADAYGMTEDGIVPWRERPQALRRKVVARIPALPGS